MDRFDPRGHVRISPRPAQHLDMRVMGSLCGLKTTEDPLDVEGQTRVQRYPEVSCHVLATVFRLV